MKRFRNVRTSGAAVLGVCCALAWVEPVRADWVPNVEYRSPGSKTGTLLLDVYRPEGAAPKAFTIVLVHGGGYNSGRKEDMGPLAIELAMIGYTVITPNYTLATTQLASFPQPITDLLNVVRWARTDGEDLGIPNRIVLCGHSAGSTIAMTAALAAPLFANQSAPTNRGYVIDGAIGLAGRYDLVWNVGVGIPATVVQYLGVAPFVSNWNITYASASAVTHVSPCSPPTVLYHGTIDAVIPVGNMYRLETALQNATVPVEMHAIAGIGHDLSIIGWTPGLQALTIDDAVEYIAENGQAGCGRTAPPPPIGRCCQTGGACVLVLQADCAPAGWVRNGSCEPNFCPQPGVPGACCRGSICVFTAPEDCTGLARFAGSNMSCNVIGNATTPCCKADFNQNGTLSVHDIFDYLNAWFAQDVGTSIDTDGTAWPTLNSVFEFLNAWFSGC